ncbi:MAG: hypothetical protein QGG88_04075 [Gammaproteobacteria bacterium]|jgi:hypothetical protein|nr:hypothetical protein [Gammaproteobacteria bacterium]
MTNSIAQFNIQFDAVEDRLQLRVLSTDDKEIRVWLTRRYVRLLLQTMSEQLPEDSQVKLQKSQLDHGSTATDDSEGISDSQFDEQYKGTEDTALPLGADPVLVSNIACREQTDGNLALVLGQQHEDGVKMQMSLSTELAENLVQMLLQAARVAEWDLNINSWAENFANQRTDNTVLH